MPDDDFYQLNDLEWSQTQGTTTSSNVPFSGRFSGSTQVSQNAASATTHQQPSHGRQSPQPVRKNLNNVSATSRKRAPWLSLRYLVFIVVMGGVAVSCTFFALSYFGNLPDTLYALISNTVATVLACCSEGAKLQYDSKVKMKVRRIFYGLIVVSGILATAAPAIHVVADEGEKKSEPIVLTATLLLCCNGCLGVFDIAERRDQEIEAESNEITANNVHEENQQLREQNAQLKKDLMRQAERSRKRKNALKAINRQIWSKDFQKNSKRRRWGFTKHPKDGDRPKTFSLTEAQTGMLADMAHRDGEVLLLEVLRPGW